jgi:hypothetical protein
MKTRTILASLAMWLAGFALCFAADLNMGTWKLNEAKSKLAPGTPKNTTIAYAAAGDTVKVTVDGVDGEGKPAHNEWTGQFDGKEYPVTGDPNSDTLSYKRIDDRTLEFTGKKGGKLTVTGRVVVAADGKSRSVTAKATDAKGNIISSTTFYDKQ